MQPQTCESELSVTYKKSGLYERLFSSLGGLKDDYHGFQADPIRFGEEVFGESYTEDIKRLFESVRDNEITIAISANATGKTHGAARVAVWWYKAHPDAQVYTAAAPPESNLKKLLWGEIGDLVSKHPKVFEGDTPTNLHLSRSDRSFLTGVTIPSSGTESVREAKFSGKHAPHLLFILDEGDAVPDEVYKGIESCMSGGHARLLVMFNPRSEAGEAYRMIRDKRAHVVHLSAMDHPNVVSGEDVIPGAVTRIKTVRRIQEWCRPLADGEVPGSDCFELPEFLHGVVSQDTAGADYPPLIPGWYKVVNPAFSYMVLGRYPAQGVNQLISRDWLYRARDRWDAYVAKFGELPMFPGVAGHDVAEEGPDSNAVCFRHGPLVMPLVVWGGVDVLASSDRVTEICRERGVLVVNVDATGTGAGCAPYLKRQGLEARAVKVASSPTATTEMGEFYRLRDQLWWACREWLRTDDAMLPPDEGLIEELSIPTYEVKDGKIRVMDKPTMKDLLKRSPDKADALCLTFYAHDSSGGDRYQGVFK
jgi:hypothetical protein